jgi:hypothetical protein
MMLSYLGSWMVHHSWDGLRRTIFEGFGRIFEKKYDRTSRCCLVGIMMYTNLIQYWCTH